jgi:translocation and assembly module TamB
VAELKNLVLHTGTASNLKASASLQNFAHPEWQASVDGTLELRQIALLSGVDGLKAGTVDLSLKGHSCDKSPVVAQKHPRF